MPGNTAAQIVRREFRLKNFGFDHPHHEAFYQCQWRWPSWVYLVYRALLFLYSVFALAHLVVMDAKARQRPNARPLHHVMVFLTTWTYIVLVLHLLVALLVAVWGAWRAKGGNRCRRLVLASAGQNTAENGALELDAITASNGGKINSVADGGKASSTPSGFRNGGSSILPSPSGEGAQNGDAASVKAGAFPGEGKSFIESAANPNALGGAGGGTESSTKLPWFLKLSWVLWSIISVFAIIVTVIYFTALYPQLRAYYGRGGISLADFNVHALNSCFIFLDAILSAKPVRLFHVIYPLSYGFVYVIFSLIFWSRDPAHNVIYPYVLDWNHPGLTVGVIVGLALLGGPLLQLIHFGLYRLRLLVFRSVYGDDYHHA